MSQKNSTGLVTRNPAGKTGHMLMVYHPGLSSFPRIIAEKFIEGAISRDWKVTIAVFSKQPPKYLTEYDIIAFLSPGYGSMPRQDFTSYIHSLNLERKPCIAMITSGGGSNVPTNYLKTQIQTANGIVVVQGSYAQLESKIKTQNAAFQLGSDRSLIDAIKK